MQTLTLALRLVSRDWRAGELRVLMAAIVLAVASVGTVGFFADRVKAGLAQQANLLLGADLMISGDRPLPSSYGEEARKRGLATSPAIRFNSMVQQADAGAASNAVLTDVKAVANGYPLRGAIALIETGSTARRDAQGIPKRGEAWIDRRLADRLGVDKGARLAVGEATFTVSALVAQDPEIAGLTFAPGPKLLLNLDDVPATNLLQPGNRATWRLLIAERTAGDLERFQQWLAREIRPGQRVESVRDLRPEVRQTLERAERFLGLSALVAVLLAAVVVALTASRYLRRHLDAAA
ncbi:MAG TPA: ABC transporter permease, partial [Casimicrobiaceae bacterium]|nr:ABC transporter permease [Casimicrobiaceae bacterium]